MGGVLALFVAGLASLLHRSLRTRSIVVDVTAWYWHFMALLWIYIFCLMKFVR
jgi:heme/copper-type cytochrome/quinol oxidase subunit 3